MSEELVSPKVAMASTPLSHKSSGESPVNQGEVLFPPKPTVQGSPNPSQEG